MSRLLEPEPLLLASEGQMLQRNLRKEPIAVDRLKSRLRQQGIEDLSELPRCMLESNGESSVILRSGKPAGGGCTKSIVGVDRARFAGTR